MALTNPGHFERDMINGLKKGFEKYLKFDGNFNFNHRVIAKYMELFKKVVTKEFVEEYRNISLPGIKIMIDRYAKENDIPLKEL